MARLAENFSAHDIAFAFLNNVFVGSNADRNLYVDAMSFDGKAVTGGAVAMTFGTTQHFTALAPLNWDG